MFFLYSSYKQGFLPEAGGLMDQPSLLLEYFRSIDLVILECSEERLRTENKKSKKGSTRRKSRKR